MSRSVWELKSMELSLRQFHSLHSLLVNLQNQPLKKQGQFPRMDKPPVSFRTSIQVYIEQLGSQEAKYLWMACQLNCFHNQHACLEHCLARGSHCFGNGLPTQYILEASRTHMSINHNID